MSLQAPDMAVLQAIHDAGLGLERGVNLFAGPTRPGKGLAAFCASTGGMQPNLLSFGAQEEMQTVQVQVWSPIDESETGLEVARACLRAVHRRKLGGYYHTQVREVDPPGNGRDDSGRNGYVINVELHGIRR